MLAPSSASARKSLAGWIERSPIGGLLSLRYMMLRGWTAGSALLAGLLQTYVFARVLSPDHFSLFILVGALGISMWLFDLGLSKILFVRLRQHHLVGESPGDAAAQANAVALFYGLMVMLASFGCFAAMAARPGVSIWQAAELGLFLLFSAINLPWFVLRNVSVAVDEFIFFESLESLRRIGYMALLLALLAGLPLPAFVVAINLGWVIVFVAMAQRLMRRRALAPGLRGATAHLRRFFSGNWKSALRTGTHAAGELYIHYVLYLVVPIAFGLGAPTIIIDTALKIFLGLLSLCSAACDLLVPRQTAAYAARDSHTLVRATLMAAGLCALPALAIAALLLVDARGLFAVLLGPAAVMPPAITPILLVLLAAGVGKAAPNFLLQHTGYFREVARLSMINIATMTLAIAAGVVAGLGIVGLMAVYAAVLSVGSVLYIVTAIRGPIRHIGAERPVIAPG